MNGNYGDNFYFDIAIHKYDEIDYSKYLHGRHSLKEMAEEAKNSDIWDSLEKLTPINLDNAIEKSENKLQDLKKDFYKTRVIRGSIFVANIVYLITVAICAMLTIKTKEPLLIGLFICLAALAALGIPLVTKAAAQIRSICKKIHNEDTIVKFLHQARKELISITP